jgi:hypothetical protein
MRQPLHSPDEIAQRGEAIYQRDIQKKVEADHKGKILVLDIYTGDYEIDSDHLTALRRARAKNPDATLYALRVGFPVLAWM